MIFKKHSTLEGQHAFLSPSKYQWLNYSESKLSDSYEKYMAIQRGTELHELAKHLIMLGVVLPDVQMTLNMYVNDAIGYRMIPEQPLFYSINCYGTADSISFDDNLLRIHDLKTGVSPASIHQLEIYASLFCLEYKFKPSDINMELRIYQNDNVAIHVPDPVKIEDVMNKIVLFDKRIDHLKEEALPWTANES